MSLVGPWPQPTIYLGVHKMSLLKRFKKFYRSSAENRIQIHVFLGFVIIPIIGMTLLYIFVRAFWL